MKIGETVVFRVKALHATDLDALQFTFAFDPAYWTWGGISVNEQFVSFGGGRVNGEEGVVTQPLINTQPDASRSQDIEVAEITLTAKKSGTTDLELRGVKAPNSKSQEIQNNEEYTLQASIREKDTPVPIVSVGGVTVSPEELSLDLQTSPTGKLEARVTPQNATNTGVEWSSSNDGVAIVDSNGTVTATGKGNVTVTVRTLDGDFTASADVIVTAPIQLVRVTGVTVSPTALELNMTNRSSGNLQATVIPEDATEKRVHWSSSNTAVATVDSMGTVKAVGKGAATITVQTMDGSFAASAEVTVVVPSGGGSRPPSGGGFPPVGGLPGNAVPLPTEPRTPPPTAVQDGGRQVLQVPSEAIRSETVMGQSGRLVTVASVEAEMFIALLDEAASGDTGANVVSFTLGHETKNVRLEVPASLLTQAASSGVLHGLEVRSAQAAVSVPIAALLESLGTGRSEGAALAVVIEEAPETGRMLEDRLRESGGEMLASPMAYHFTITMPNGVTQEIEEVNGYVEHVLFLDVEVPPAHAAGVLVDERTGEYTPVPLYLAEEDGRLRASLLRRGNSVYTVVKHEKSFADVPPEHYAKTSIEALAAKFVVNGIGDGSDFGPGKFVTRAEFAALLNRALGISGSEEKISGMRFTDVTPTDWYAASVAAAADVGLIGGYEDGTFRPNARITRVEMAVMMQRALQLAEFTTSSESLEIALERFADASSIPAWGRDAVSLMVEQGIMGGMNADRFAPGAEADRAQSAVILHRAMKLVGFMN
ncbi:S-layer homology domain-containing protein [Paenibacillus sp. TRM 82003]|nr:S-layer homology domain-containing protein [Paenibacillus sp. TRM 82003]